MGEFLWIGLAFGLGLLSKSAGLPPLVGYLATGFLLASFGISDDGTLKAVSDLGITLLLFTVGLKLNFRTLVRPQVWAVSMLHMVGIIVVLICVLGALASLGLTMVSGLGLTQILLIAFALSFSSTVYAVKVLEEKGEMTSFRGRIAVGILIIQDIAAVVFLAVAMGAWPSMWAVLVLLLLPMRPLFGALLKRVDHGELLVLYGFVLALGGATFFEIVGLKGDLGALVLGALVAHYPKAEELSKTMLRFKDVFLLGFFVSVGLAGPLSWQSLTMASVLTPLLLLKFFLFVVLFMRFRLRARSSLFAGTNLTTFSEFGLIVVAISVANRWLSSEWLSVLAIAISFSFLVAVCLNRFVSPLYRRYETFWRRKQSKDGLVDERSVEFAGANTLIIGMGGIGSGAYDKISDLRSGDVVGVDIDPMTVTNQAAIGRNVLLGDPSDADFWDRVQATHTIELVLLTLPSLRTNLAVLRELKIAGYSGRVSVIAKFSDEEQTLKSAGATTVFNVYDEAGAGFATHVNSTSE